LCGVVVDMNDRALRQITASWRCRQRFPHAKRVLTLQWRPEAMAILCLSSNQRSEKRSRYDRGLPPRPQPSSVCTRHQS
jgi:formyltetrahydrofolate synthetase